MTIEAAKLLDEAFATYLQVASAPDDTGISRQSPSWHPLTEVSIQLLRKGNEEGKVRLMHRSTPYDFAAALVRSLLPYAYNYDPRLTHITEELYVTFVEALEVLPFDNWRVKEILASDPSGYTCNTCGYPPHSYGHHTQCS